MQIGLVLLNLVFRFLFLSSESEKNCVYKFLSYCEQFRETESIKGTPCNIDTCTLQYDLAF